MDEIRILMGDQVSLRTRQAFEQAVGHVRGRLDDSLEREKDRNPLLDGVAPIVESLQSGKIKCRVYRKDKFHAKAYITHARMEVVGSAALVGSSNFTFPGLTENLELNVQITGRPVTVLQEWFEQHWDAAEDVTPELLKTVERHTAEYTPFEIYAKALQEYFRGHEMTAGEWDQASSRVFPKLDRYQQEAYWALMKISRQHRGAFLCDGVGLGKTFVGLMLIERLVRHEKRNVMLLAPKPAKEAVWEPHLKTYLPHIGGVAGGADFSNLAVFSHTDLSRKGDFPERFKRMAHKAGRLPALPPIPSVHVENTRTAFFDDVEFRALVTELPDAPAAVVTFLYWTGWRRNEVLTREWRHVDFDRGVIVLEPGETKSGDGRTFPFAVLPELKTLLERQRAYTDAVERRTGQVVRWLFHRDGVPVKSIRQAWRTACRRAGIAGRIPHDFRRTAVRRLERAGVPRSVAMQLVGHRSEAIYRRYAITNETDLREGLAKVAQAPAEAGRAHIRHRREA